MNTISNAEKLRHPNFLNSTLYIFHGNAAGILYSSFYLLVASMVRIPVSSKSFPRPSTTKKPSLSQGIYPKKLVLCY